MSYRPGDSFRFQFYTEDPATGAIMDATGTPTATLTHNDTDDGTLTVVKMATARYQVRGTLSAGYSPGDDISITALATVNGVQSGIVVAEFKLDGYNLADVCSTVGASKGVVVSPNGLDNVIAEAQPTPINLRQAIALAMDAVASLLTGAQPTGGTVTVRDPSGANPRIVATCDSNGNRTGVTLTPPA
jgi:hypothetical protein